MAVEFFVPKLGQTVEEVTLVNWLVPDGAKVAQGQEVLEVETDKAVFPVEANGKGYIHFGPFEAGQVVPVLTVVLLAVLSAPTGFPRSVLPFLISEHVRGSSVAQYCVHAAVQKATVALDLYFLQYNRYPDAFEELERAGMLTRRDIDDLVATHGVVYARQGASYTLAPSPGL